MNTIDPTMPTMTQALSESTGALAAMEAAKRNNDPEALKKAARDFESVLLTKVMDEMRKTVPESGLTDDCAREQVQSLFWSNLAQDMANKGGVGLWKQLYRQMQQGVGPAKPPAVEQLK